MVKKEYEPWRKSFILQLYESTKDAVEVARRNYLEGRLANGLKREMHEMRGKYESFCKQNENQGFLDKLDDFRSLEEETDAAIVQLKERSDEFVAISSSGWPYKVEFLTYDEILRVQLPNYNKFLFDPSIISFGPISEKWEKLKASFSQEFLNLVSMSPRLSIGRSYLMSAASSMSFCISEAGAGEEEEAAKKNDNESDGKNKKEDILDSPIETDDKDKKEAISDGPLDSNDKDEEISDGSKYSSDDKEEQEEISDVAKENVAKDEEMSQINPNRQTEEIPSLPPKTTKFTKEIKADAQSTSGEIKEGSSKDVKMKPQVVKRKPNSIQRTLSGAWSQILNSAAQSAEKNRVPNRSSDNRKTGVYVEASDMRPVLESNVLNNPGPINE